MPCCYSCLAIKISPVRFFVIPKTNGNAGMTTVALPSSVLLLFVLQTTPLGIGAENLANISIPETQLQRAACEAEYADEKRFVDEQDKNHRLSRVNIQYSVIRGKHIAKDGTIARMAFNKPVLLIVSRLQPCVYTHTIPLTVLSLQGCLGTIPCTLITVYFCLW